MKYALNSIHLFWSNLFILPVAVTKRLESLLSSILWVGEIKVKYTAKVGWKELCKPKNGTWNDQAEDMEPKTNHKTHLQHMIQKECYMGPMDSHSYAQRKLFLESSNSK